MGQRHAVPPQSQKRIQWRAIEIPSPLPSDGRGEGQGEVRVGLSNHGSELKNRSNKFFPRSSSASEIHSSAVCACATSPGPNTTLGIPPADKIAASQKKCTPSGFIWPTHFMNC